MTKRQCEQPELLNVAEERTFSLRRILILVEGQQTSRKNKRFSRIWNFFTFWRDTEEIFLRYVKARENALPA